MLILAAALAGCQLNKPDSKVEYRTVTPDPQRNTELAGQHNARAVELLKAALAADLFFGPASGGGIRTYDPRVMISPLKR